MTKIILCFTIDLQRTVSRIMYPGVLHLWPTTVMINIIIIILIIMIINLLILRKGVEGMVRCGS